MTKLTINQMTLLRLARKCANDEGWAPVSRPVLPFVKELPTDLVDVEELPEGRGRVRVTDRGNAVLDHL
jgi:hypothetical protein